MFIDKIEVGEKAEKYSRTASQDIWIHYRDIGMLNDVKKKFDIESPEEIFKEDIIFEWDNKLQTAI